MCEFLTKILRLSVGHLSIYYQYLYKIINNHSYVGHQVIALHLRIWLTATGVYPLGLLWKALPLFAVYLLPSCHLSSWFLGRTSIQVSSLCNIYSPLREQCDRSHRVVTCGRLPFAHNHLLITCICLPPICHLNIAYQRVNISKHNFQKLPKKQQQKNRWLPSLEDSKYISSPRPTITLKLQSNLRVLTICFQNERNHWKSASTIYNSVSVCHFPMTICCYLVSQASPKLFRWVMAFQVSTAKKQLAVEAWKPITCLKGFRSAWDTR